jgi:hypothetical protein
MGYLDIASPAVDFAELGIRYWELGIGFPNGNMDAD